MIFYVNGRYVPREQAAISPEDRGFLFGDAIYEVEPLPAEASPHYAPGIFLRLPITDIDHVVHKSGKADPRVLGKAEEVKVPLNYVSE